MEPIKTIVSTLQTVPVANIDTDQIIPARFLTTTDSDGLGQFAFADCRQDWAGNLRPCRPGSSEVLVAGTNFGCGSSREHAPWAMVDYGIKAVISDRIADIFRSNALKNGLVAIEVPTELHQQLLQSAGMSVEIDIESCQLRFRGQAYDFALDPFAQLCLLQGTDALGFLLAHRQHIDNYWKN
ncbi:MAG: 3-isopropylmalate dehydratase small subunit [Lysobacteraceae bacterium]|nr:MAG: 3-isopropylmalate dehydratase small subunit [Xanthomonadaceae bacterium]